MFISVMLSFINTDNIDRVSGRLLEHTPHLLDLAFGGGGGGSYTVNAAFIKVINNQ